MAEPDRDRLRDRQSSRNPTRQLQITGGFEDSPARFHRLLQQDFRPTVPMELHRSPRPKRRDQTAKQLEGKPGKTNTAITDFRFGVPTTMTCGTSFLDRKVCRTAQTADKSLRRSILDAIESRALAPKNLDSGESSYEKEFCEPQPTAGVSARRIQPPPSTRSPS